MATETDHRPPIPLSVLMANQHIHVDGGERIGTTAFAIRMLRLFCDHFEHVVDLAPVRQPDSDAERAGLQYFPPNVECKTLYRRGRAQHRSLTAWQHLASLPRVVREMIDCDLVYARVPHYPAMISAVLAILMRKPLLLSIHGNLPEIILTGGNGVRRRLLSGLSDRLYKTLVRRAVFTMITGEDLRKVVGDDVVSFSNHQFQDAHLFERADTCQSEPIKLLYVGIWDHRKGIDVLLDALSLLVRDNVPCRLQLVGFPVDFDIDREIGSRALDEHVDTIGRVNWGDDLFAIYRASDVFVFPSLSEGMPKVPMEALSQSLPVVATPSGTSCYVDHEHSGLIVPPSDPEALARAIRRMIEDGELRRRCIAGGFEVARANTRDKMYQRIGDALRTALSDSIRS